VDSLIGCLYGYWGTWVSGYCKNIAFSNMKSARYGVTCFPVGGDSHKVVRVVFGFILEFVLPIASPQTWYND